MYGQEQGTLQFFLNYIEFGMDLQEALDAPTVYSIHFPSSFYHRPAYPGQVVAESRLAVEPGCQRVVWKASGVHSRGAGANMPLILPIRGRSSRLRIIPTRLSLTCSLLVVIVVGVL
jgi:hypothetical protein